MQGGITSDFPQRQPPQRLGFEETELEKRGARFEFGAPITSAITTGNGVAASFGDGTVRFFHPSHTHTVTQAHEGVVLCLTSAQDNILTGGDDGRFIQISSNGTVTELANFGTKWVDCVAASNGLVACSSGPMVHLWSSVQSKPTILEHSSTVGGLTFDPKGKRLAVAH